MNEHASNGSPTPHVGIDPMPWVQRWLAGVRPSGRVLDWACGSGRHSLYAMQRGLSVLAIDKDRSAIDRLTERAAGDPSIDGPAQLQTRVVDLESGPWPVRDGPFDAIIVANYLFRPRLDLLLAELAAGGRLIYATFALGNELFGKPSNPDYLLDDGELVAAAVAGGLRVVAFEHGQIRMPAPAVVQRLCAVKGPAAAVRLDSPD